MALKPIQILINAKDNASGVFSSLQAKVAAVGAAIGSYFSAQTFIGIIKGASDFEGAMSRVQAATGASGAELQALKQAAEDAGASTKFTSVEAAAALENLAKAGLDGKDAIAALPAVLNLAQAADVDLARSAEYVTKAVMGMGLQFEDAGRVTDVLAKGANATNTSVEGLAQALSYAAPVANSLGLSLEGTVAIIGKFADAGIDASRAGTALNSILSQFSDPASKFREELNAAGITTGNFEQALHQLAAAGPAGSRAILAVGQEAGPALRALLNQGMGALDELKVKLQDSAGSAAETARVMQDNLKGSFTGLASAWDTVKNVLGTPVLPVLKDGVDQLAGALRGAVADGTIARFGESMATAFKNGLKWVQEFAASLDMQAIIAKVQGWADGVGEAMNRIGEYATNAGNIVRTAWGVMTAGLGTVMAAIFKLAEGFATVASGIQSGLALIMDGFAKVTFGVLSKSFKAAADEVRLSAEATGAVAEAYAQKASAAFEAATNGAVLAQEGFAGLVRGMQAADEKAATTSAAIAQVTSELEKAGKASIEAADAQRKKIEADDAAKAAAETNARAIAVMREEYAQLVASGNLQAAAELQQKIAKALGDVGTAAVQSSKQIEMAAAAIAAKNTVAQASLKLQLEQEKAYEANARAIGNEYAALQSKIRQKEIEIKIVEATAKAMRDEAEASIRVAEAKLAEMKANKEINPAMEAELRNRIELGKAKKLEAEATRVGVAQLELELKMLRNGTSARHDHNKAIDRTAQARDAATAALERENAALERSIAAQEKANQLKERAAELERKKWNVDKDGFTLDSNGQRMQQGMPNERYVYDTAKGQGLDEATALRLAGRFWGDGKPTGMQRAGMFGASKDWFTQVNEAINAEVLAAARQRQQAEYEASRKPAARPEQSAPASPATTASRPANSGVSNGITHVLNINLDGQRFGVNTDAAGADNLLRVLERGKLNSGR